jgi:hypothetical protein
MTLVPQNEYSRLMVEKFDERKTVPVPTAFQGAFYGRPETGARTIFSVNAKLIEIDIVRSTGNRLAQMVNRGTGSEDTSRIKNRKEGKYTNVGRQWPLVETTGSIENSELLDRPAGVNPYDKQTREDRLTIKAMEIHAEDTKRHISTVEYLCRQALFTGEHPAIFGTTNSNLIYDFYRNAGNTISAAAVWTNAATDILGDLDDGADQIQQNAYLFGDYGLVVDSTAFGGIKLNTVISGDADNRRYQFVALGGDIRELPSEFVKYRENGFNPRGYIETPKGRKVWIFTYDLTFIDDFSTPGTDTVTPWIPSGQALMFHPKARCDRYFGPPDRMPVTAQEIQWYREMFGFDMGAMPEMPAIQNASVIDSRMFYCDAYVGQGNKAVFTRTQSAPIMPTTQTDAFVVFTDLI